MRQFARRELDAALDIVDVKNGDGTLSDAALTFNALKTFQVGLGSALDDASAALQVSEAAAGVGGGAFGAINVR